MADQSSPAAPNETTNVADASVRMGLICGVLAYTMWGMLPIYLKQLGGVDPLEIVAHRILWSVPFGALILALRKQWRETLTAFLNRRVLGLLAISAALIAVNWLLYVWAVANERVLQASLGYYINPLMFVAAGVIILKERLNRIQMIAVALAAIGVATLTVGAGVFPYISLLLALTFTAYGYARKMIVVGAMPGLFIETALLAPFALGFLLWWSGSHGLAFGAGDLRLDTLLALAGPVTVAPLVFFALAARRLQFSTLGFLQYIGPTGQFLLGLYYGENFTIFHAFCFGLIWMALLMLSVDAVRRNNASKKSRPIATTAASAIRKN